MNLNYEGVAMSAKHASLLGNILDKAIFAVMRLRDIPTAASGNIIKSDLEDKESQDNVTDNFKDSIEEGRKYVERVEVHDEEEDRIEEDAE